MDHRIIYAFTGSHESFVEIHINDKTFNQNLNFFKAKQPEYRLESDDITIEFLAESNTVCERTATKIFWEVTNATQVTIEGIGRVSSSAKKPSRFSMIPFFKVESHECISKEENQ